MAFVLVDNVTRNYDRQVKALDRLAREGTAIAYQVPQEGEFLGSHCGYRWAGQASREGNA